MAGKPTERVLSLAAYAQQRGAITLDDIVTDVPGYEVDGPLVVGSQSWETVRKRLQRDLDDLREHWGIDLAYAPADERYQLGAPFFTPEERRALIAAAATVEVEGVASAQSGAIGSAVDDSTTQIVIRVHALVAQLRAAIATRSTVTFSYEGDARTVQPWALGTWRHRWYLAAFDPARDALRRFRLDRFDDGTPTIAVDTATGAFTVPHDFDIDAAFDLDPNVWGTDPEVRARVRVGPDHGGAFCAELGGEVVGEVVGNDGHDVVVELDVREYGSFRTRVLSFGGHAVVESPPELVDLVTAHLRAIAGVG